MFTGNKVNHSWWEKVFDSMYLVNVIPESTKVAEEHDYDNSYFEGI